MIKRSAQSIVVASVIAVASQGLAQPGFYPGFDYDRYPPIRHDVPFHRQQTMVWCWVAVAKMIAEFYGKQPVPDQCRMLQIQYGAPCCDAPELCARPGYLAEIQALVSRFGGRMSELAAPTNAFVLYEAMRRGPIIMHTRQGSGHVVVTTGIRIERSPIGPLAMVSINDPFFGRYEVDFPQLMQVWTAALVVY